MVLKLAHNLRGEKFPYSFDVFIVLIKLSGIKRIYIIGGILDWGVSTLGSGSKMVTSWTSTCLRNLRQISMSWSSLGQTV